MSSIKGVGDYGNDVRKPEKQVSLGFWETDPKCLVLGVKGTLKQRSQQ